MLQKKLEELEAELADVFRLPLDQTAAEHLPFDDIKERFRFLEKLRAAEADSDQLRDLDERIAGLKAAFSDWNQSRSCVLDNDDGDDALSVCSDCTMQQALQLEDFSGQKLSEKDEKAAPVVAVVVGRTWSGIGKYCGVFGGGMIVGAVCMVLKLFYADYLIRDESFLIPPT